MAKAWKMKLTCDSKNNIFQVEYPELNCQGTLVLKSGNQKKAIFIEKINNGACVNDGYIIITSVQSGLISFTCLRDNNTRLASYCTLEKMNNNP